MPKVSVIVPVYNVEKCIERCIYSIINQTEKDIEIILVDDGSTDKSSIICDLLSEKDKRIKVIHKKNGGLTSARLSGFQIAEGDYISFIDSDDYIDINMYKKMVTSAQSDDSDICFCPNYYFVKGDKQIRKSQPIGAGIYEKKEIKTNLLLKMAGRKNWKNENYIKGFMFLKIYRKSLIDLNWFVSEREYFAEDVLFSINAFANAKRVTVIQDYLYYYVYNSSSLSNKYREGLWDMYRKMHQYLCNFYNEMDMIGLVQDRLNNSLIGMAFGAINNNSKRMNKANFYVKIKKIRQIIEYPGIKNIVKYQREDKNPLRRVYYKCIINNWAVPILLISTINMRIKGL